MNTTKKPQGRVMNKLRSQFIAGILVAVPLGATILILVWLFNSIDHILQPAVRAIFNHNIPGVGFGVTIVLIYLAGVIATNIIGRRILRFFDHLLNRVPIFKQLYGGIRQILDSFAAPDKTGFMQVVLVQFPKDGLWTIGLVTNELVQSDGEKVISVFVPTSPTPWSGFFQMLKEREIIRTTISVQDAIQMVISCGRTVSEEALKNLKIK